MESDGAPLGYLNRPTGQVRHEREPAAPSRRDGPRSRMRIALVALRAYEQRAERHAAMRAWLMARAAGDVPAAAGA